jgi:drug/metabolite transporter (DMT)-like permease
MDRVENQSDDETRLPLNAAQTDEETSSIFSTIGGMRRITSSSQGKKVGHWKILLFGQFIALVAASANACSFTLIYNLGVEIPMTELFITYSILALFHVGRVRAKSKDDAATIAGPAPTAIAAPATQYYYLPYTSRRIRLHVPWWIYGCVSLLDVMANFMMLISFRYTSLMSTSLLGSLTIPSVMVVSWLLLGRVFYAPHYMGVALCLLGGTMTVWLDMNALGNRAGHSYVGDALAISAALMYGLGDCLAEYSIKHIDRVEYLFGIGFGGAVLTGIFAPLLEAKELYRLFLETSTTIQLQALLGIAFYVAALVLFYISTTLFLVDGDATLLVLSLQATQFWAILFSVVLEHHPPTPTFFVAVVFVVAGVFIYETSSDGEESAATEDEDEEKSLVVQSDQTNYCTVT